MPRAKAIYRALLLCYPAAFRHEYGDQMLLMFAEQMGEARRTGSRFEQAKVRDPANTKNILSDDLSESGRQAIAKAARNALYDENWKKIIW